MPKALPIYLLTLRKRWGLSQRELAFLLRISPPMLSKLERLERRPTASIVIAAEIIFGASSGNVFPALYEQVETKVMKQAAILYELLEAQRNGKSKEKCRLLLDMIKRMPPGNTDV